MPAVRLSLHWPGGQPAKLYYTCAMPTISPWLPVVQVTLPIVLAIGIAAWLNNRRIDDLNRRIDDLRADLNRRIDDLRNELLPILRELQAIAKNHEKRISVLEERSSPILRP